MKKIVIIANSGVVGEEDRVVKAYYDICSGDVSFSENECITKGGLYPDEDGIKCDTPTMNISVDGNYVGRIKIDLFQGKIDDFADGVLKNHYDMDMDFYTSEDDFFESIKSRTDVVKAVKTIQQFIKHSKDIQKEVGCIALLKFQFPDKSCELDYRDLFIHHLSKAVSAIIQKMDTGFNVIDKICVI